MPADDEVFDSPTGWVADHIRQYVASGGETGHVFHGVPALLLTTTGRRSGRRRRTALYYGEDDGRYLLVASNGGSVGHPAWYLNLTADPDVEVQVGAERFTARARTAGPEEKPALWRRMVEVFPQYDQYQAKARREIPLVILERSPQPRPGH